MIQASPHGAFVGFLLFGNEILCLCGFSVVLKLNPVCILIQEGKKKQPSFLTILSFLSLHGQLMKGNGAYAKS